MRSPAMVWLGVAAAVMWCGVIGVADQAVDGTPRKSRGPAGATIPPGSRSAGPRQPVQEKSTGPAGRPTPARPAVPNRNPPPRTGSIEKDPRGAVGRGPAPGPSGTAHPAAKPVAAISPEQAEFFEKKIRPVLVQHCLKCHSGSPLEAKGGLLLDSAQGLLAGGESGPAVVTDDPEEGSLIAALRYEGPRMPPSAQLPESVINDFVHWVKIGAPFPERARSQPAPTGRLWSLEPVRAVSAPPVHNAGWPISLADSFLLARLEAEGLAPAPAADRETLLRDRKSVV